MEKRGGQIKGWSHVVSHRSSIPWRRDKHLSTIKPCPKATIIFQGFAENLWVADLEYLIPARTLHRNACVRKYFQASPIGDAHRFVFHSRIFSLNGYFRLSRELF